MTSDDRPEVTAPQTGHSAVPSGERGAALGSLGLHPEEVEAAAEGNEHTEAGPDAARLDLVLDIPVRLSVELGRTEIPIRDVVSLGRGSMIELDGSPGAPLDVRVNGLLIGRGEVVVVNEERLGLRFIEVVGQAERVKRLK
jgi:flagellar motor switch protein FliN/FliY